MNASYMMIVIGTVLAVFILYLNVAASIWLVKSTTLNSFQKWRHSVMLWLIPYVGVRFVLSLLRETDQASLPRALLGYRAFDWLKISDTHIDAWASRHSPTTQHRDVSDHETEPDERNN